MKRTWGGSCTNGELQCCQTHQLMLVWLKRQNEEWKGKTNGKRAYFFKGVRHRSSASPSCPGSHWAADVCTELGHFLRNMLPLEKTGVGQRSIKNRHHVIEKIKTVGRGKKMTRSWWNTEEVEKWGTLCKLLLYMMHKLPDPHRTNDKWWWVGF